MPDLQNWIGNFDKRISYRKWFKATPNNPIEKLAREIFQKLHCIESPAFGIISEGINNGIVIVRRTSDEQVYAEYYEESTEHTVIFHNKNQSTPIE